MEITREQREGFMRLLQEAKTKKNSELQRELEQKVKEEVLPKIMQRQGIVKLVEQVKNIGSQLSESAQKLQGMDVFGQPATLWGKILGTNEGVEELVEKMKRPYTERAESSLRDYDHAILRVLSVASLEDAQRIVEDLL
jgi:ATP-dependent Lon protease